jgi:hypothetical protein
MNSFTNTLIATAATSIATTKAINLASHSQAQFSVDDIADGTTDFVFEHGSGSNLA